MVKVTDRFCQILGLCCRAGKLVSGTWAAEDSIRRRKAELVIVSTEASDGTKNRILQLCKHRRIDVLIIGTKEELGQCIGKSDRTVIAINDKRFKAMLIDTLPDTLKANMGVINEWQR